MVDDIGVDAVKIGMLGTRETIDAVGEALDLIGDVPVVLDPVMVAESGGRLLDEDAEEALRSAPGAAGDGRDAEPARGARTGRRGGGGRTRSELARAIHALGPANVVVTGGHREQAIDVFFDGERLVELPGERYPEGAAHGSGCTHSSALAAHLALGLDPLEAAREAKRIASEAVRDGLRGLGAGAGPVDALGIARRTGAADA